MKSKQIICFLITMMICLSVSPQIINTSQNSNWEQCAAKQGDTCRFVGNKIIKFGDNQRFVMRISRESLRCETSSFGSDPKPNQPKSCQFYNGTVAWKPCSSESAKCEFTGTKFVKYGSDWNIKIFTNGTDCITGVNCYTGEDFIPSDFYWKECAREHGSCKFNGTQVVRYGLGDNWVYFVATNSTICANQLLGDPLFGTVKVCQYQTINEDSCPNDAFLYGKQCVSKCPEGTSPTDDKKCRFTCPETKVLLTGTKSCLEECPNGYYVKKGECFPCGEGTYTSLDQSSCVSKCPDKQFYIKSAKRCYAYCPSLYKTILGTNECVYDCARNNLLLTADRRYCSDTCLEGQYKLGSECLFDCPYGLLRNARECVATCPEGSYKSADKRSCVSECREGSFLLKAVKQCLSTCPLNYLVSGNECVATCPEGSYKSADKRSCVSQCRDGNFLLKADQQCYTTCPLKYLVSENECVATCPEGSYKSADNRSCVSECRDGNFLLKADQQCYTTCPLNYLVSGNECVATCPEGSYRSYDNYECLTICPDDHFLYRTTGSCYSNCPANSFVFQNECVDSCPTGTVLSADRRNCVSSCYKSQYLLGIDNSCLFSCPLGFIDGTNECK